MKALQSYVGAGSPASATRPTPIQAVLGRQCFLLGCAHPPALSFLLPGLDASERIAACAVHLDGLLRLAAPDVCAIALASCEPLAPLLVTWPADSFEATVLDDADAADRAWSLVRE